MYAKHCKAVFARKRDWIGVTHNREAHLQDNHLLACLNYFSNGKEANDASEHEVNPCVVQRIFFLVQQYFPLGVKFGCDPKTQCRNIN